MAAVNPEITTVIKKDVKQNQELAKTVNDEQIQKEQASRGGRRNSRWGQSNSTPVTPDQSIDLNKRLQRLAKMIDTADNLHANGEPEMASLDSTLRELAEFRTDEFNRSRVQPVLKIEDGSKNESKSLREAIRIRRRSKEAPISSVATAASARPTARDLEQEKTVKPWIIKPVPLSYQYSKENELQKENTYPCVYYSNQNPNAAIPMMKLDNNVLTIHFSRKNLNAEEPKLENNKDNKDSKNNIDFIPEFLDRVVICHGLQDASIIASPTYRFCNYSSTIALMYPAYHIAETLKIFCDVLHDIYDVPVEIIEHLQQSMKCRNKTPEEEKFLAEISSFQAADQKVLKLMEAQATLIDAFCKEKFFYQPFMPINGSEQKFYAGYALYLLAMKYYSSKEPSASSSAYRVFNSIDDKDKKDNKDNLYYPLAQFYMGKLILEGRMAERPPNDQKYHARAMRHLLRSTEKGFHQGLQALTLHDVTNDELRHFISRAMKSEEVELGPNHRLIRVRQRVETWGDLSMIAAKLDKKNSNNKLIVKSNDSLHLKSEADVVSSLVLPINSATTILGASSLGASSSTGGSAVPFVPMLNAVKSAAVQNVWVTVDATKAHEMETTSSHSNTAPIMAVAQTPPCAMPATASLPPASVNSASCK